MVKRDDLISPVYLQTQRALHGEPRGYGASGQKHAWSVMLVAEVLGCRSILDYGCGQGTLGKVLHANGWDGELREYDPAVKGKDALPVPAEMVVCTDVLEHIEPKKLDAVLDHIRSLTGRCAYLSVSVQSGSKQLRDGRNVHLIVWKAEQWTQRIAHPAWRARVSFVRTTKDGRPADLCLWMERR